MAYFANGTDAEIYQANYCNRCQHFGQDKSEGSMGCPILDMHFDHNRDDEWKVYLDAMIPPAPAPEWHGECTMFSEVNMKPDRLYQPQTPAHQSLMVQASYELRELARECAEWAETALEKDGHEYAIDNPEHVCNADCEAVLAGYGSTGMWLHQMWALDAADAIDRFLSEHDQSVAPAPVEG